MIEILENNLRRLLNSKKILRGNGYNRPLQKQFDGLIRELETYGWIGGDRKYFFSFLRKKSCVGYHRVKVLRLLKNSRELTAVFSSNSNYKINYLLNDVLSNPIDIAKIKMEEEVKYPTTETPNHPISKDLESRIGNKIAVEKINDTNDFFEID